MSDMIERLAKAIAFARYPGDEEYTWPDDYNTIDQDDIRRMAAAAITAHISALEAEGFVIVPKLRPVLVDFGLHLVELHLRHRQAAQPRENGVRFPPRPLARRIGRRRRWYRVPDRLGHRPSGGLPW